VPPMIIRQFFVRILSPMLRIRRPEFVHLAQSNRSGVAAL
jgi:hypothetical protein